MAYKQFLRTFFRILCLLTLVDMISIAVFIYNPKWFYYRPWEYFPKLAYRFSEYEALWDEEETSDLTRRNFFYYQDPHRTYVSTDEYGFRSNRYKVSSYEILVSGDSTIFGSGLSDNETLPWKISEKINLPVFNGGQSFVYNTLLRPELSNVKLIIDCVTERNIKGRVFSTYGFKKGSNFKPLMTNDKDIFSLLNTVPAQRYLATSIAMRTVRRIANDLFIYLFNAENNKYRFINHRFNEQNLDSAINSIVSRKENINAKGIEYIFVAIPAKQTIYGSNIDEFTRNYINLLVDRLQDKGVQTINLVGVFRANKSSSIYPDYDTHWNSKGVNIAASTVSEYLTHTYSRLLNRPLQVSSNGSDTLHR